MSVIIANYHGGAFLEEAVRSALGQTLASIEVIVADDLSTDDSPEIARRLAREDARVTFLPADANRGPAGARNRALDAARGDWVAILDSDDLMQPDRLLALVEQAEQAGADIVADDLIVFDQDGMVPAHNFLAAPERRGTFVVTPALYLRHTRMFGRKPNLGFLKPMIRRAPLEQAGIRYDESLRIAEDDDLIVRLLAAGWHYIVVPTAGYRYRKHSRSISHRLKQSDLTAILATARRTRSLFATADRATRKALAAREASFADALAFQRFLDTAKARRPLAAAAALARRPRSAALLRLPMRDKLLRAWRSLRSASLRPAGRDHETPPSRD